MVMFVVFVVCGVFLGYDFCVINFSDNMKFWDLIEKCLWLVVEVDFVMVFYNFCFKLWFEGFGKVVKVF